VTAREAGLPEAQWYTVEDAENAKGRPIKRRVERYVETREVSLLKGAADVKRLDLPQLDGGDPRPFEVVGIPLATPGYYVVEIESLRLGTSLLDRNDPMYVRTGVLVTNLGVHFKRSREASLVWVTTLDRGKPVEGADVAVYDCRSRQIFSGRTDAQGLARIGTGTRRATAGLPRRPGLLRHGAQGHRLRAVAGHRRYELRLQPMAKRHRVVALQPADRFPAGAGGTRAHGVRSHALAGR
jgi:hypothetical protein